jgi:putative endonuclease
MAHRLGPGLRRGERGRDGWMKPGYVYIMTNMRNGTLYIGATSNLPQRVWQHREGVVEGFTKRHGCKMLVWYEGFDDLQAARQRELQMKEWQRAWKLKRIEAMNPDWRDLYVDLLG